MGGAKHTLLMSWMEKVAAYIRSEESCLDHNRNEQVNVHLQRPPPSQYIYKGLRALVRISKSITAEKECEFANKDPMQETYTPLGDSHA